MLKLNLFLLIIAIVFNIKFVCSGNSDNLNYLFKTFKRNLKEDLFYAKNIRGGEDINVEEVNEIVNRRIHNFIELFHDKQTETLRLRRETSSAENDDTIKGTYSLQGIIQNGTVSVNFPKDICLFKLNQFLYAAALHNTEWAESAPDNRVQLTIFKREESNEWTEIFTHETKSARSIDCISTGTTEAFVAIVNTIKNVTTNPYDGSPIFQLKANEPFRIIQYFTEPNQNRVYLRTFANGLYLFQSFQNGVNRTYKCPIYKWTGYHFDILDELACTNAMKIEPFFIGSEMFIAIANYNDEFGEVNTFSVIYKFNVEYKRFILSQKIQSHAAVDVKYFRIMKNAEFEHFIILANSYEAKEPPQPLLGRGWANFETKSIIYKYVDDYFIPFQAILLYDVQQFLPVLSAQNEFTLFISCKNQEIKSWKYDGWNFKESDIQFTGGALGKGVSNMRNYLIDGITLIVVANSQMSRKSSNIFVPQYKFNRDVNEESEKWCENSWAELATNDPIAGLVNVIERQPMKTDTEIDFSKSNLLFENIIVKQMNTNSLTTNTIKLDQNLADQINRGHRMVAEMNQRFEKLDQQNNKQNGNNLRSVAFNFKDQQLESQLASNESASDLLNVDELIVNGNVNAKLINNYRYDNFVKLNGNLNLTSLEASEIVLSSYDNYMKIIKNSDLVQAPAAARITIDSLVVDGTVNQIDFGTLEKKSLKLLGDQVFEEGVDIDNLRASAVMASKISELNISDIVRIKGGTFRIEQDIQFAGPKLITNNLIVLDRINNINVNRGNLDVLLKHSNQIQIIRGFKTFDDVTLLNPINLQGKIFNSNLDKINPIVSITEDIVLEGDYEISGNVTIRRLLAGENLFGKSRTFNVAELFSEGLSINDTTIENIIEFVQPIKSEQLFVGAINNLDTTKFITAKDIQTVNGWKEFTGDLHIFNGFCDAIVINNVNLPILNETILRQTGNQIIEGAIHFQSIDAKRISANRTVLWGHNYSDFLTKDDQFVAGNVTLDKNLLIGNNLEIRNLQISNQIFGFNLTEIIEDSIFKETTATTQSLVDASFLGDVTFDTITVNGNVFNIGRMEEIENMLIGLSKDVELTGPVTFTKNVIVSELQFGDSINLVSKADFGTQWMLSEVDQEFTEPQTIADVKVDNNVRLIGRINNFDLRYLLRSTLWLNESLSFRNVSFENMVLRQPLTLNGLISGLAFPQDIIHKDARFPQNFPKHLLLTNDFNISGNVFSTGTINGLDYKLACDLTSTQPSTNGLIVLGDATFDVEPNVVNLNGRNLHRLLKDSWFSHETTKLLGNLIFKTATFDHPVSLKGQLNERDLGYLNENYISVTRPQTIVCEVEFLASVFYQNLLEVDHIVVDGSIMDSVSKLSINIEEFNEKILKKDANQVITGQWSIYEVDVMDNLPTTLINGLDLSQDVVRYSASAVYNVTAQKHFKTIEVERLYCAEGCAINNVDIVEWIGKAALLAGNYTIQGLTTIDSAMFFNDIRVFGLVNNRSFSPESILLKSFDQEIKGNVYISTKYILENKIFPLSFEFIRLDTINLHEIGQFYQNIIYQDDPISKVETKLTFSNPLTVTNLKCFGTYNGSSLVDLMAKVRANHLSVNYKNQLEYLNQIGGGLIAELSAKTLYLDSFEYRHILIGHIRQIVAIKVVTEENTMAKNIFAVLSRYDNIDVINFYKWHQQELILDNDFFAFQPQDMAITRINALEVMDKDYLIIETKLQFSEFYRYTFFTYFNNKFRNVYEIMDNSTHHIRSHEINGNSCLVSYSRFVENVIVKCAYLTDKNRLDFKKLDVLSTPAVEELVSVTGANRNELVLLDVQGRLHIWLLNGDNRFALNQIIKTVSTTRHITTIYYHNSNYIATCSPNTSGHSGSIEIYRSNHHNSKYVHVQSIFVDEPIQLELSIVLKTNLLLYVLTENPSKPFLIYKYAGVGGFQEFTVAKTIGRGAEFSIINQQTQLIAIVGGEFAESGAVIIEANFK